jgi:membrane protein YqaA with SNARE-associated domain
LFFISETILGLIPPDFFIVWANSSNHPIILTTILAGLSYIGGLTAYFIGFRLSKTPKINKWLLRKFSSHFATLHKYGGFLIVFSALLPLPFSTVTAVAGMVDYPFQKLALLGSTRILRFFGYGYILSLIF